MTRRLLVDFAGIGDLVILVPFMRQLGRDGELELLARPWGRAVLQGQPFLSAVHVLPKPNVSRGLRLLLYGPARARLGRELSARGFDEIVIFRQERRVVREWIESWKASARLRECDLSPMSHPGMTAALLHALSSGGFPAEGLDPAPRLIVPDAARAAARSRLALLGERVVLVHPGSSDTRRAFRKRPHLKGLTPSQWAGLLTRILTNRDADAAAVTGSTAERRESRQILACLPDAVRSHVHDLTGKLSLGELMATYTAAHALVSIDTGPAHLAAAVGCPLLDIFGPTDPALYLPRGAGPIEMILGSAPCQFCHGKELWKTCRDNICLNRLSHERLYADWARLRGRLAEAVPAAAPVPASAP